MPGGLACQTCGVGLPDRARRCPSCRGRTGLGRSRARVVPAVAAGLLTLGLAVICLAQRSGKVDPTLAGDVEAYIGLSRLTGDERGTYVTAFIDNKGTVPVDVKVRLRAFDIQGHAGPEVVLGPHRQIAAGASKSIGVAVSTTPIEKWEIEIIELARSPR